MFISEKFIDKKLSIENDRLNNISKSNSDVLIQNSEPKHSINNILKELQKEIKPLFALNELHKKIKDEVNNQTTWISGLVEISLPLE